MAITTNIRSIIHTLLFIWSPTHHNRTHDPISELLSKINRFINSKVRGRFTRGSPTIADVETRLYNSKQTLVVSGEGSCIYIRTPLHFQLFVCLPVCCKLPEDIQVIELTCTLRVDTTPGRLSKSDLLQLRFSPTNRDESQSNVSDSITVQRIGQQPVHLRIFPNQEIADPPTLIT